MNEDYKTTTEYDKNEVKGVTAMKDSAIITIDLYFCLFPDLFIVQIHGYMAWLE